jgi:hypothetical protein
MDFERATATYFQKSFTVARANKETKWEKPPMNYVKVNWDAAISKDKNVTGV